jgi:tetrahydromethanopterin S-methyltransferase subunit H
LGNPKVKPKEVLETTTIAAKQLLDAEAETLTAGLLELADRCEITIVLVKPGKTEEEAKI